MSVEAGLAQAIQGVLDNASLHFDGRDARALVSVLNMSVPALIDQYLTRANPPEEKQDSLVTVHTQHGLTSRFLQQSPHTNNVNIEVGIWLLILQRETAPSYYLLREQIFDHITKYFTLNPQQGIYKNFSIDDHPSGRSYVLSTKIQITKKYTR